MIEALEGIRPNKFTPAAIFHIFSDMAVAKSCEGKTRRGKPSSCMMYLSHDVLQYVKEYRSSQCFDVDTGRTNIIPSVECDACQRSS